MGRGDVYETFTNNKGELFKSLLYEHGRCMSKIYIDSNGKTRAIGWVFEKKLKYTDRDKVKFYIQETWITLHESEPVKTIEYNYLYL